MCVSASMYFLNDFHCVSECVCVALLPWTVRDPEASALPTMFSARQVYEPTSAGVTRRKLNVLSSKISNLTDSEVGELD